MTFPHDQIRDDIRAEDHSLASIAMVSVTMIVVTLATLSLVL